MNNLFDRILSKAEAVASRPGHLMVVVDKLLDRVTPKDSAAAAEHCYWQTRTVCNRYAPCNLTVNPPGSWENQKRYACYNTVTHSFRYPNGSQWRFVSEGGCCS